MKIKESLDYLPKQKLEEERKSKLYPLFNLSMSIYGEEKKVLMSLKVQRKRFAVTLKL